MHPVHKARIYSMQMSVFVVIGVVCSCSSGTNGVSRVTTIPRNPHGPESVYSGKNIELAEFGNLLPESDARLLNTEKMDVVGRLTNSDLTEVLKFISRMRLGDYRVYGIWTESETDPITVWVSVGFYKFLLKKQSPATWSLIDVERSHG